MLRWTFKATTELESNLTSIERVIDYSNNPSEVRIYSLFILKNIIEFKVKLLNNKNVTLKLKNLNFESKNTNIIENIKKRIY